MTGYNLAVVEKKGPAGSPAPDAAARTMRRARRILALLLSGVALVLLAPAYAWLAINYSGKLALAQTCSAAQVVRGFDFGPVYMREGVPGRYYLSATLPEVESGVWQTTFEVLDAQKQPVYRQDELRFIGDYLFQPGEQDRYQKGFQLDRSTGYYYFRFTAQNGIYDTQPGAPPVVEFAVRQGVIEGWPLWGPAGGAFLLGLLLLGMALAAVHRVRAGVPNPGKLRERNQRQPSDDSPLAERLRRRLRPSGQPN
jgi:hypothetical protein